MEDYKVDLWSTRACLPKRLTFPSSALRWWVRPHAPAVFPHRFATASDCSITLSSTRWLIRLATSFSTDRATADARLGVAVRPWRTVLVLQGPRLDEAAERHEPVRQSRPSAGDVGSGQRREREPIRPDGGSTGCPRADFVPKELRWKWDWQVRVVNQKGKEVYANQWTSALRWPNELVETFDVERAADVKKVIVQARSFSKTTIGPSSATSRCTRRSGSA